ncbi:MAG TPA: hypothetical protein PKD18_02095 [Saprospiraceae bacterium]|nr:hypothetical protein [Saprospiraceae bacterium]
MIICDTNIWYRLGDGRLSESDFGGDELVVTGVNVEELCTTETMLTDPTSFKNAIKAINKYATQYIDYDPIEFILIQISDIFIPHRKAYKDMMDSLQIYLSIDLEELMKDEVKIEKLKNDIVNWNEPSKKLVNQLNSKIQNISEGVKEKYHKKQFRKKNNVPEITEMFLDIFQTRLNKDEVIDPKSIDWENFKLLILGWDTYFKEKSLYPNNKFKINDLYDLMNLSFVQKHDKYWTVDQKEPYTSLKNNIYAKSYFY